MPRRLLCAGVVAVLTSAVLLTLLARARETFPKDSSDDSKPSTTRKSQLPNMVQNVTFLGAKHIKEEELRNLTGVRPGQPLNPNLNRQGCQKIMEKYEEQGRSFSHCALVKGGERGDTEVIYEITEGPKVKVADIKFSGDSSVSGSRLAAKLHSTSEWFHLVGGAYNKQMAESDLKEVIKYFRSLGYNDVKVALETQRSPDGCEVTMIFHIQEGQRSRVEDHKPAKTAKALPEKKAEEQPLVRVGQVFIIGNKDISQDSILAHVPLFPGQILNYSDLQQAEKDLAKLGVFVVDPANGVRPTIAVINPESDSAFKDILITVKEKPQAKHADGKP